MIKSLRCVVGMHDWEVNTEKMESQGWHRTDCMGRKVSGSDYNRKLIYTIEKCSRCGKERAFRHLTNPVEDKERISLDFALARIEELSTIKKEN